MKETTICDVLIPRIERGYHGMAGAGLYDSPLTFFWEHDREKAYHLQSQNTNTLNRVKAYVSLTKKRNQNQKQGGQHAAKAEAKPRHRIEYRLYRETKSLFIQPEPTKDFMVLITLLRRM